jgi:hypothetical protein
VGAAAGEAAWSEAMTKTSCEIVVVSKSILSALAGVRDMSPAERREVRTTLKAACEEVGDVRSGSEKMLALLKALAE